MNPSSKLDLLRQQATQALTTIIDDILQKKIDSKGLRGHTLPMEGSQIQEFIHIFVKQIDDALVKLFTEPSDKDEKNSHRPISKNKKNDPQALLTNVSIVDDDALVLQLIVERHAKALHAVTRPAFGLLSLRMEKLADQRFDITQNPLHPLLIWYSFRQAYEHLLSSKYDRKSAVHYWAKLLEDEDWIQLLTHAYEEWIAQLNKWLVANSVLPYADHEDVRTRYLRKEHERAQAKIIRNDVISTLTGSSSDENTVANTAKMHQQLSRLIKNYKPAAAMAPHLVAGNSTGKPLNAKILAHLIDDASTHSNAQISVDTETGYLNDASTQSLAQTLSQHSDANSFSIDKHTQTTVAILSMIFDQLKKEENIEAPIKALISSLQWPVLNTAVQDEGFFADADNSAQQLIGEFTRVGNYWSPKLHADQDMVYKKMLSIVENVQRHYHDEQDIFEHSLEDLQDFLDKEEYKTSLLSERLIEAEKARARARQAREMAQTLMAEHIGDHKIPLLTSRFLSEHWQQVLFFTLNQNLDVHTEAMQRALQSLDSLIAAAKGDTCIDLHQLLADIRRQLIENGSDFPERKEALRNLFLELKVIASAVTKTQTRIKAPQPTPPETSSVVDLPLEEVVGAAVEMVTVDFPLAKKSTPEIKSEIISDAFTQIVDNLHNNVWFKFTRHKVTLKIKLAVIIKQSDTYIFINNNGQKMLSDTREGVTERLRNGTLVPLAESAYFDRALQSVVHSLRQ